MAISVNVIKKVICIACGDLIKDHSKKQCYKCIFRLQGTIHLMDQKDSGLVNKSDVIANNEVKVMRRVKDD
jgi:hypothetical protein